MGWKEADAQRAELLHEIHNVGPEAWELLMTEIFRRQELARKSAARAVARVLTIRGKSHE